MVTSDFETVCGSLSSEKKSQKENDPHIARKKEDNMGIWDFAKIWSGWNILHATTAHIWQSLSRSHHESENRM